MSRDPSPVAVALMNIAAREEAEGLERLVEHYGYRADIERIANDLGISFDLSDAILSSMAWSLVGPRLAEDNSVFNGRSRGAPRRELWNKDTERAAVVAKVSDLSLQQHGARMPDSQIIEELQSSQHSKAHLFRTCTLEALKNSVSRGNKNLNIIQELVESLRNERPADVGPGDT